MLSFRKSIYLCWWFSHWNHYPLWKCARVLNACVLSVSGGEEFHLRCYWFGCVSFSELHSSIWLSDDGNITNLVVCISFHRNTNVGTENWRVEKKKKEEEEKAWRLFFEVQACFDCVFWQGVKISSNKQKYRGKLACLLQPVCKY